MSSLNLTVNVITLEYLVIYKVRSDAMDEAVKQEMKLYTTICIPNSSPEQKKSISITFLEMTEYSAVYNF